MLALAVALGSLALFALAYRFYGGFLDRRVFGISEEEITPAVEFKDGLDYVPSDRRILFGHHFASIAGLGPILGPAVAVIWGWLPAVIWIVVGAIFFGAVHDFGSLVISARNDGKSIGEVVGRVVSPRARILFMILTAFLIALAMGVFALVVGSLFAKLYPEAVVSVFGLMVVAVIVGILIYRYEMKLLPVTIGGVLLMLALLFAGIRMPVNIYKMYLEPGDRQRVTAAEEETARPGFSEVAKVLGDREEAAILEAAKKAAGKAQTLWIWILLGYAFVASILPVWLLLQPRDYLNSYLLYVGMAGIYLGLVLLRPEMAAPFYRAGPADAPPIFPMLFVVIACGAISGFHCMVASGTTCKQLARMKDARYIGYGGMLAEGALAVGVVLACAFALGGQGYTRFYGGTWDQMNALPTKIAAFVEGGAYLFNSLGMPLEWGKALIALVVVSFAMTTLDSGTRLLRYNLEELAKTLKLPVVGNRYVATFIGVLLLAFFAFIKIDVPDPKVPGEFITQPAGLAIWQLFGTSNQILAALGLLAVAAYLKVKGKATWPYVVPFLFLVVITSYALYIRLSTDLANRHWALAGTGIVTAILAVWLAIEGVVIVIGSSKTPNSGGPPQFPAEEMRRNQHGRDPEG